MLRPNAALHEGTTTPWWSRGRARLEETVTLLAFSLSLLAHALGQDSFSVWILSKSAACVILEAWASRKSWHWGGLPLPAPRWRPGGLGGQHFYWNSEKTLLAWPGLGGSSDERAHGCWVGFRLWVQSCSGPGSSWFHLCRQDFWSPGSTASLGQQPASCKMGSQQWKARVPCHSSTGFRWCPGTEALVVHSFS